MSVSEPALCFLVVGENPVRLWGLSARERTHRIARAAGLEPGGAGTGQVLLVNAAVAFDPAWLRHLAATPDTMLTLGGVPALAHVTRPEDAEQVARAMREGQAAGLDHLTVLIFEQGPVIENKQLRKRETPFLIPLNGGNLRAIERASYFGAYKGVTDLLTKYLWPEWALVLTRLAARLGLTPNMVTSLGAIFCFVATVLFARGQYWEGLGFGLAFMVLDTVDGKLARCTITSSKWGNLFDHGMDLFHPPFWWWFWATGLSYWHLGFDSLTFWLVQAAIQGGYVVQRFIEGVFMRTNGMMHIHVWRRFDSRFRLITARRNPNMLILFGFLLFSRPDLGLIAVAWWTAVSCAVHAVRLAQAVAVKRRGGTVSSWLSEE